MQGNDHKREKRFDPSENIHNDHKCEICNNVFNGKQKLKNHICTKHFQTQRKSSSEKQKYYKCESCGKSFSEVGSLKIHIHTIHEGHKD